MSVITAGLTTEPASLELEQAVCAEGKVVIMAKPMARHLASRLFELFQDLCSE